MFQIIFMFIFSISELTARFTLKLEHAGTVINVLVYTTNQLLVR